MAYNTGNAPGSTHPKDLIDNAEDLDYLMTGGGASNPNRLGVPLKSWKGMEGEHSADQARREAEFDEDQTERVVEFRDFLKNSGYETPVVYAPGLNITRPTQTVRYMGEIYRPKAESLPFLTTTFPDDEAKWVANGDNSLRQELVSPGGESLIGMTLVNVTLWGLRGDAISDNLAAFNYMIANIPATSTPYFPKGVYRFSDGIVFPLGMYPIGDGISVMGAFPTHQDDKRFLRPGYKHLIPGTAFRFTGVGTHVETTVREAPFNSFRPAVTLIGDNSPAQLHGITVFQDMDVLDAAGNVTTVAQDNRADYDVGVFIRDSCLGRFSFVSAGYWKVAGVLNYGNDPDSNTFTNGSSMGERGFVNLGTGSAGHSGTESYGWMYYANDHHKRDLTAAQWGTCALMYSSANGYNVDGLYIHGGRLNTYCDTPLILNDCSNVWFFGTVMELPDAASPGATTSKFIGNANCDKIGFIGCRWSDDPIHGAGKLDQLINGTIIMTGSTAGFTPPAAFEVLRGGKALRLRMPAEGPSVQLSNTTTSSSAGIVLRLNASDELETVAAGVVIGKIDQAGVSSPNVAGGKKIRRERSSVVVAAGAITATRSYHLVSSGTGSGVDLSTINGGTAGDELFLQAGVTAEPITLKTTGGNIRIGTDFVLAGFNRINLIYDGGFWAKSS